MMSSPLVSSSCCLKEKKINIFNTSKILWVCWGSSAYSLLGYCETVFSLYRVSLAILASFIIYI